MAERVLSPTIYMVVLAALILLTLLTVGVSFIPLGGFWHIFCGLTIALIKASLVVLFFMHALYTQRVTWAVIGAAILWIVVLFSMTLCDYFTRGAVPFTPGH